MLFGLFTDSLKHLVIKVKHLNELSFCDLSTIYFGMYSDLREQFKNSI